MLHWLWGKSKIILIKNRFRYHMFWVSWSVTQCPMWIAHTSALWEAERSRKRERILHTQHPHYAPWEGSFSTTGTQQKTPGQEQLFLFPAQPVTIPNAVWPGHLCFSLTTPPHAFAKHGRWSFKEWTQPRIRVYVLVRAKIQYWFQGRQHIHWTTKILRRKSNKVPFLCFSRFQGE